MFHLEIFLIVHTPFLFKSVVWRIPMHWECFYESLSSFSKSTSTMAARHKREYKWFIERVFSKNTELSAVQNDEVDKLNKHPKKLWGF